MSSDLSSRWKYIDIHAHIIPGVDDGAETMEESMSMIETAYQEGIRAIIATPHYGKWNPDYNKAYALDMKLFFGNEIFYGAEVIEDLRSGRAMTLGGTDYVLVEFSTEAEYITIAEGLREFVSAGYRPVLAHVERYSSLHGNLKSIRELIENGTYIQVNARSYLGKITSRRTLWCRRLLDERMVHFIASDCHDAAARKPVMKSAVDEMLRIAWDVKNELI